MAVMKPTIGNGGGGVYRHSLSGRVLITGGAGFIGRAIIKTAQDRGWDTKFTVLSRDEQKQHSLHEKFPDVRLVLGDIRDPNRLGDLMWGHDIVIHAAALKYIPEAEFNVAECVSINLEGSINVIMAAQGKVDRVVALSTDKASGPLNVYGATKMLMERMMIEADLASADRPDGTRYTVVRYGNVIGSTGSVIPTFREQIRRNKAVTVTDLGMTRFWITPEKAVDLICEAASCDERGVTVIPHAEACNLHTVLDAIREYGEKFEVDIVGRRPGEKMFETLINEHESTRVIEQNGFYYLLPQGRHGDAGEPFELTSDNALPMGFEQLFRDISSAAQI